MTSEVINSWLTAILKIEKDAEDAYLAMRTRLDSTTTDIQAARKLWEEAKALRVSISYTDEAFSVIFQAHTVSRGAW